MAIDVDVRAMTPEDLELAVAWAAAEGWNPGLADAAAFRAADPGGFLMAWLDDRPAGCVSAVRYPDGFGFVGFYIVTPELRGRGIGMALWRAAMQRLADVNIGLDGVLAQEANYVRSGFTRDYGNIRFEGLGGGQAPAGVASACELPFAAVATYDRQGFPSSRAAFLRPWLGMPGAALAVPDGKGGIRGYGVIRPCGVGHKIGPLFADGPEEADTLFAALAATVPGEPVFLDVPAAHAEAMALAERHALTPCFETTRMYTRGRPDFDLARVYGVTTFELG